MRRGKGQLTFRFVLSAFTVTSCANLESTTTEPISPSTEAPPSPQVDVPAIDWDNPIDGELVSTFVAADAAVPFVLYVPKNLPAPESLLVTDASVPPASAVVALVYDVDGFGRVVIKEHFPDVPASEYAAINRGMLELNGQAHVHGTFEIVTIRESREALITTSEDGSTSSIFWLEGPIELIIRGPELDRSEVLKLAESI
jgi:hypothetical protein